MVTEKPSGSTKPLKPPEKTRTVTGVCPASRNTVQQATTNAPTASPSRSRSRWEYVEMNEMEVKDAPITDVIAAAQSTTPKILKPMSPAAAWNASAAGLSVMSRIAPADTTPSTARNSSQRMTPVAITPSAEVREISRTLPGPEIPLASSLCAPAYVMLSQPGPPTIVVLARTAIIYGATICRA